MVTTIFICFAQEDEKLYLGLEQQLQGAARHRNMKWSSNKVAAGSDWQTENEIHLNTADIILLLISPAFMASDYHYHTQAKQAMERHKRGEAVVIPVILRPTDWQGTLFGKLKVLPTDAVPVTHGRWHTRDEAFFNVIKGVLEVMKNAATKIRRTERKIQHQGRSDPPGKTLHQVLSAQKMGARVQVS